MDELKWLAAWYQHQCDGEWEHSGGIEIGTMDNPGWYVHVDLKGTCYADMPAKSWNQDDGDGDWVRCTMEDGAFRGYGDCGKLGAIIRTFRSWIER